MKEIRSEHHGLRSCKVNNVSLSCYGDKRYILDNGIADMFMGFDYAGCLEKIVSHNSCWICKVINCFLMWVKIGFVQSIVVFSIHFFVLF